jgi:RNA polymerase sigma-70 factor (ECF subfamily)
MAEKPINNETNEEDFQAVKQVLAGNNSAFQILQKKYIKVVAALIRKMIKNEDDVEDLVQETFIKAYNALNTFQFGYAFSAWLYRIASNNCIDFLRKKRFATVSLDKPVQSDDDDLYIEIEDTTNRADMDMIASERHQALYKAIDALPENYKIIIKMRHEEELDYTEIAVKLDLPLGTVKAHLFRARKILYTALKNHQYLFQEN